MRITKMFGFAAIAAIAAMAFVGASSASAALSTQLCTNETGTCVEPTSVHYLSVNPATGADGHIKLVGTVLGINVTIECDSLITGTPVKGLVTGGPATINATIAYSGCLHECEVTVLKQGTIKVQNTGSAAEKADVTGAGQEVLVNCEGLHCIYKSTGLVGAGLGPLKSGITGNKDSVSYAGAEVQKVSGFLCPSVSKLTGTFADLTSIWARE